MKKIALLMLGVTLALSSITLTGCKKGPDDPFLSFRSRATRLSGTWKLQSGTVKTTQNSISITTTYTDTKYTINNSSTDYSLSVTFVKDGTYTSKEIEGTGALQGTTDATGAWNWVGGTGDTKSKEQVIMYEKTSNYSTAGFSSKKTQDLNQGTVWTLKSLKNKTMVVTWKSTTGSNVTEEGEFTFTQE